MERCSHLFTGIVAVEIAGQDSNPSLPGPHVDCVFQKACRCTIHKPTIGYPDPSYLLANGDRSTVVPIMQNKLLWSSFSDLA